VFTYYCWGNQGVYFILLQGRLLITAIWLIWLQIISHLDIVSHLGQPQGLPLRLYLKSGKSFNRVNRGSDK